jgi:anti-sigma factor RsiW
MGLQIMERPFDRHIDVQELDALVPLFSKAGEELSRLSTDAIHEAERHLEVCEACTRKVSEYRDVMERLSNGVVSKAAPLGPGCPQDQDVDWYEVAAGLWPESKANQLILHAALCNHCGPLLRAATSVDDEATPDEEKLLVELKAPSRPAMKVERESIPSDPLPPPVSRWLLQWKVFAPALALMMIMAAVLGTRSPSNPRPLAGSQFAEFVVRAHRQHALGHLALDVRTDSQQALNEWFQTKAQFSLVLPASPAVPGEEQPNRLEGARLVQVGGKTAAFIAYQMSTAQMPKAAVSLVVAPDSVAVASGGVVADFKKVSFHYATLEGYKVVTWSVHGRTYALVSQEGNSTQRSCMVCHSAMHDRDLTHTPTPLPDQESSLTHVWQ